MARQGIDLVSSTRELLIDNFVPHSVHRSSLRAEGCSLIR